MTATMLVGSLGACRSGGKNSDADIKARLTTQLSEGGLDATEASCVAEVLVKEVGVDRIKKVELSAAAPTSALGEDIAAAMITARGTCKVDLTHLPG